MILSMALPQHRLALGFLAGLLVAGACFLLLTTRQATIDRAAPDADAAVVATVDGEPITSQSLLDEMIRRARLVPGLFEDPAARRELLDERIRFETIVARARAAGYETDPALAEQWKRLLVRRYEAEHLEARTAKLSVSDAEIKSYYQAHLADYTRPERRRVALIFIEVPRRASAQRVEELTRKAEEVLAAAGADTAAQTHFGDLARTRSDDRATRYRGGDVGWLAAGQSSYRWGPKVVAAMFALSKPGELSAIVRGEDGFYLLRLMDVEAARPLPLEQIRPTIRHALLGAQRKQLAQAFYAELAGQTRVEIDLEALEALRVPRESVATIDERGQPPPLPGG